MSANWEDEYLTIKEIAEHLKLNQQTLRNWINEGQLPAVRIGRRVRVRRVDLDRILAQGTTAPAEPPPSPPEPGDVRDQLTQALEHARELLGRSAARRAELVEALQELTDAAAALQTPSDDSDAPTSDAAPQGSDVRPRNASLVHRVGITPKSR
jgi:excisionase family DNA binding protein